MQISQHQSPEDNLKRRIRINRRDGVRQRYWVGKKLRKNHGSFSFKKKGTPILIKGSEPGKFVAVDSEKLKRDKKALEERKVIVLGDPSDPRNDLAKLEEIRETRREVRNQSRKDIKFAPIEDLRTELENESYVMQEAEDKLSVVRTPAERRIANMEWLQKDERFRAIKEKLSPKLFSKFNLSDEVDFGD